MTATTRQLPHPELVDLELPTVLFALSDPARLELVKELATHGPLTVAQCQATGPDVPKSTFSHHLKTLREAGLIRNEPAGRQRTITLRRFEIDERFPVLATRRRFSPGPRVTTPKRLQPGRPQAVRREAAAGSDTTLREDFAQMPINGARAEEQLDSDLGVGVPVNRQPRDLCLLVAAQPIPVQVGARGVAVRGGPVRPVLAQGGPPIGIGRRTLPRS